jgi:glyoxylase-like metal-dependent hydrolase (beta-lactamase superfamily II)
MGDRVFTGDTLLIRGTGRTDFQNGDPSAQYDSIFNRLLRLPDETLIYPAHDYKGDTVSTIGEERAFNPRLQVRSLEEYVDLMGSLNLPNPKMMDVAVPANMTIGLPIRPLHRDLLRAERLERHPHDLAKRRLVPRLLCQDVVGCCFPLRTDPGGREISTDK